VTQYGYDGLYRQASVTTNAQLGTSGQTVRSTGFGIHGEPLAVSQGGVAIAAYSYNPWGQPEHQSDSSGVLTTYYDAAGNVPQTSGGATPPTATSPRPPLLTRRTLATDALGHSATFVYDVGGELLSTTDRNGRTRNFTYDGLGRATQEAWVNPDGSSA